MKFPEISDNMICKVEICRRRYAGEDYIFYVNGTVCAITGNYTKYVSCTTPENCLGYGDVVLYSFTNDTVFALHRHHPDWIMREIHDVFHKIIDHYDIEC